MSTKSEILKLLELNIGQTMSGARLAEMLGLSRNAVWKAINELRKDGYDISSSTNVGYCLLAGNDILSAEGIAPYLSKSSDAQIHIFRRLDSTNQKAKELAVQGAPHGAIIIADSQSAGRGRGEHLFYSPPGAGLYMSAVLRPPRLRYLASGAVTAFAAVVAAGAIEELTGMAPRIKRVNDLLLGGRKICGILTEAAVDFESGAPQWIVVGIGINVSTRACDFPPELAERAGSLYSSGSAAIQRNRLAAEIINRLLISEPPDPNELMAEYESRLI